MRWLFILVASLPAAGDAPKVNDAAVDEREQLRGAWILESVSPALVPYEGFRFIMVGDEITVEDTEGEEAGKLIYKLNPSKEPKEIDLFPKGHPDPKRFVTRGIYRRDGDQLMLCYSSCFFFNLPRPKEF